MLKKHLVFIGIFLSLILLVIATCFYPGGSQNDLQSVGYDWGENYVSNLFSNKAMNGLDNPSRFWAIAGMFFLCVSCAIFCWKFSEKISSKAGANVIKYTGAVSMLFAFLAVTPYHDIMITLSGTGVLIVLFYITVFLFKSKLFALKVLSVVCLLVSYFCNYIYYTQHYLDLLPIMQKVGLLVILIWVFGLEYFTKKSDFQLDENLNLDVSAK